MAGFRAQKRGRTMPSTDIRDSRYDPDSRTLSVWFVPSGRRYDYEDVPLATYAALQRAPSKERFFNTRIRDRFKYRLVRRG